MIDVCLLAFLFEIFDIGCVKDGSGALYCFIPQGKIIKAGTNSLTLVVTPKIQSNGGDFGQ
jgi:hypothetical protein